MLQVSEWLHLLFHHVIKSITMTTIFGLFEWFFFFFFQSKNKSIVITFLFFTVAGVNYILWNRVGSNLLWNFQNITKPHLRTYERVRRMYQNYFTVMVLILIGYSTLDTMCILSYVHILVSSTMYEHRHNLTPYVLTYKLINAYVRWDSSYSTGFSSWIKI